MLATISTEHCERRCGSIRTVAKTGASKKGSRQAGRTPAEPGAAAPPPRGASPVDEAAPSKLSEQAPDLRKFFLDHAEEIEPLLQDPNDMTTVMGVLVEAARVALDSRVARAEEMLRSEGRKPKRTEQVRLRTAAHYAFEEIADAAKAVGDAFWEDDLDDERYPPDDALQEAPPPYTKTRPLTVGDVRRIIECAPRIAAGSRFSESQIGLFLQVMLPHFKGAAGPTVLISSRDWSSAAYFACGKSERVKMMDACRAVFTRVHGEGHFERKWYTAQYALVPGAFAFDDTTPETPTPYEDRASHEARWLALSAYARGEVPVTSTKRRGPSASGA